MTAADEYRVKAAQLNARARAETNPAVRADLEALALSYVRLARQAERNSLNNVVYETPPARADQQQQQQQIQPKKDET